MNHKQRKALFAKFNENRTCMIKKPQENGLVHCKLAYDSIGKNGIVKHVIIYDDTPEGRIRIKKKFDKLIKNEKNDIIFPNGLKMVERNGKRKFLKVKVDE